MDSYHLGKSKGKINDFIFLQTEQKKRISDVRNACLTGCMADRLSSCDINIKERLIMTVQDLDTKQKLLDFISDKNKLSLKTNFDHKGTKEFLNAKNEAMKKIELNEDIEEDINEKKSNTSKKKSHKKCVKFNLEGHKSPRMKIKEKSINKNNFNRKGYSLSTKHVNSKYINENNNIIGFSAFSKFSQWEPNTPDASYKKNRKSLSSKRIKKESINIDKSISSKITIDSKLFDDKKDFEHYKHLIIKDDDISLIESIINELD